MSDAKLMESLLFEVKRVVVGQDHFLERVLVAILAEGHLLVEGVPGLAKTLTVNTLARTMRGSFKRIQFTPDLLPADLIGTRMYSQGTGEFSTVRGPVFANLLLADEINRAPAKVQSALLEVMQEKQVTIAGETHPVPTPFLVMATQNPIELEGTYPLPEAQLDRFMLKVMVDYPDREQERDILGRALDGDDATTEPVTDAIELQELAEAVRGVQVNDRLREYIVRLIEATRDPARYQLGDLEPLLEYGASPRASIFLARAAQAYAFIHGRGYVLPEDVKTLAPDVLRHRLVTTYEAEAQAITAEEIIDRLLEGVGIP